MRAIDSVSIYNLLQQTFADREDKIRIENNRPTNSLILSGLPEDVDVALSIIRDLDELEYANSQVSRYTPKYWGADEFAIVLEKALNVEGWAVTLNPSLARTIFLMPVTYSNDLFIFAKTPEAQQLSLIHI